MKYTEHSLTLDVRIGIFQAAGVWQKILRITVDMNPVPNDRSSSARSTDRVTEDQAPRCNALRSAYTAVAIKTSKVFLTTSILQKLRKDLYLEHRKPIQG